MLGRYFVVWVPDLVTLGGLGVRCSFLLRTSREERVVDDDI